MDIPLEDVVVVVVAVVVDVIMELVAEVSTAAATSSGGIFIASKFSCGFGIAFKSRSFGGGISLSEIGFGGGIVCNAGTFWFSITLKLWASCVTDEVTGGRGGGDDDGDWTTELK